MNRIRVLVSLMAWGMLWVLLFAGVVGLTLHWVELFDMMFGRAYEPCY